jgi:glutamate N-acetyltransferase/amino-acid N-acetyltransferase
MHRVLEDLATQIVRDGEGASKIIEITVEGAASDASAKVIACSIANSPLVKTAIAAGDANWGRVVMAIGKTSRAGRARPHLAVVWRSPRGARMARARPPIPKSAAPKAVSGQEVFIRVDVGVGQGTRARVDLRFHRWLREDKRRLQKLNMHLHVTLTRT